MQKLHDLLKLLDAAKGAMIEITSVISVGAVCVRIIWEKLKPKK
jgi:hypothetical protein